MTDLARVDAIAQAIAEASPGAVLNDINRDHWRKIARAALTAAGEQVPALRRAHRLANDAALTYLDRAVAAEAELAHLRAMVAKQDAAS